MSVAVLRGGAVESRHRVHAVRVRDGEVVESWGEPALVTFVRSAAKPVQALPLALAYPDLPARSLAIACASHEALPEQLEAVRALLGRSGSSEDDLECGPKDGSRLRHNCSGKHAGMLAVCAARGWPREGYRLAGHPLQQAIEALFPDALATAVDGCGVVTFALSLTTTADLFGRLARGVPEGAERIVAAMTSHVELVGGPEALDTRVMRALPGAVAKRGAEGILCVGLPDGSGIAFKVEDGAARALAPAVAEVLSVALPAATEIKNSRGEEVGEVVVERGEGRPSAFREAL